MSPKGAESDYRIALLRRFDFTSTLMRSSCIVMNEIDGSFRGYIKGAPERIKELSIKNTVPEDYDAINEYYTKNGYRVIALATKKLVGMTEKQAHIVERHEIESDLSFIGFLIMENKLKPETNGALK